MSHIHTKPGQHDFTVSAFIIRTDFDEPKIMLHMHKKLKKWLQFGGHVELHENLWQALEHEILEESGYNLSQLTLLESVQRPISEDSISHPIPFSLNTHRFSSDHFHTDIAYAFTTDQKPKHKIGNDESKEVSYFSAKELQELSADVIFDNVRELSLFALRNIFR